MKKLGLLVFMIQSVSAQTLSPCDINKDGVVNIADVQLMVDEALGTSACTTNLDGSGTCDIADVQRVITAALGGACNAASTASSTTIQLPVEVVGLNGTTKTVSFTIPSGSNVSGTMQLSLQIHRLRYQTQASVQVNNSAWMPINSTTVALQGLANQYGGIGGGFSTLTMTMNLPAGTIVTGTNTMTFKFNGTDGRVSGFRVLALNVLDSTGTALVPSSTFVWDDPNTWTPPSTLASDISAGQTLWRTASLTVPGSSGATAILAHCADCHAQDGRDLKYFNYSNNSIETRAQFHGLTAQQGAQIASYIRSLNVPNPGRPWNPPYQPGPGLDSQPVENWAAGAGLSAVLEHDSDMFQYLMPAGGTSAWAATGNLNAREMPIALQLLDWNSWLPTIHPIDGFGSTFTSDPLYTGYGQIRANLLPNNPQSYESNSYMIWTWPIRDYNFLTPLTPASSSTSWNSATFVEQIYSVRLWSMVKLWEINQEFGLEGMAQTVFGPKADARSWYNQEPFYASPNMIHIPGATPGIGNGSPQVYVYHAFIWYQLQLILNWGNGYFTGNTPIDFPYSYNFLLALNSGTGDPNNTAEGGLMMLWAVKGLQDSVSTGKGPDAGSAGFAPNVADPEAIFRQGSTQWQGTPAATETLAATAYLQNWINRASSFTPQQYYTGGWTTATTVPDPYYPTNGFADSVAFTIVKANMHGVSSAVVDQIISWAATVWPGFNWSSLKTVTFGT